MPRETTTPKTACGRPSTTCTAATVTTASLLTRWAGRICESPAPGLIFQPRQKLQFRFDALNDFLDTTQDALYSIGGAVKVLDRKATSTHIGEETELPW